MAGATGDTAQSMKLNEAPSTLPVKTAQITEVIVESRQRLIAVRLVVWILFGVFFGLLPLSGRGLRDLMTGQVFTLHSLLTDGELLVVSAVLAAGAMGELLAAVFRGERSLTAIFIGFGCFAMFAANAMAYALSGVGSSPHAVFAVSLALFPPTLLASGLSIGLAAGR